MSFFCSVLAEIAAAAAVAAAADVVAIAAAAPAAVVASHQPTLINFSQYSADAPVA